MKKFLSLVLALVMTMSLVTISAGAKDFTDDSKITYKEAVDVMTAVGVVGGYADGSFNPTATLTRGAAAKIICNMILGPTTAGALKADAAPYKDVPANSTFAGYIAYCQKEGIISGYADGTFRPAGTLTGYAFMKMLLGALGYDAAVEGYTGNNWSVNVAKRALALELDEDLVGEFNGVKALTREEACLYAFNTLFAEMVKYDNSSTITVGDIVITNNSKAEGTDKLFKDEYFSKLVKSTKSSDKVDDFGRPATTWVYDKEDVGTYTDSAEYVLVMDDDYTEDALLDTIQDLADNDDLTADGAKYFLNGETSTAAEIKGEAKYGTVIEVFVDEDDSDVITVVAAYNYVLDQIDEVDTDVKKADAKDGVTAYVTFKDAGTINDDKIVGFDADTYVEDAYVAIIEKDDEIIASFIPEVVNGSVATKKGTEYVTVGGTKYYASVNYGAGVEALAFADVSTSSSDEYDLYIDENGNLLGVKGVKADASIDDVYYVDVVWKDSKIVAGSDSDTYYAQLVNLNSGAVSEVVLEKKDHEVAGVGADLSSATLADFAGKLVTISDKKVGDSKKDNDKFNLKSWSDDDWDVTTVAAFDKDFTKSLTRIAGDGKTYRLDGSTKYLFLEDTKKDLDVSIYTGGVAFSKDKVNSAIILTEDGKTLAKYVVVLTGDADQTTEYSEDVVFIKSVSKETGDGFISQTVYLPDGSKETWEIDDGESYEKGKFYTYGTNSDGFYELDEADAMEITKNFVWDDEEGVVLNATIAKDALYGTLLTVKVGDYTVSDIETKGAEFVDLHDTDDDGAYDRSVNSLSRLCDLVDDGKVSSVKMFLNVSEDGAVTIFVTTINA